MTKQQREVLDSNASALFHALHIAPQAKQLQLLSNCLARIPEILLATKQEALSRIESMRYACALTKNVYQGCITSLIVSTSKTTIGSL